VNRTRAAALALALALGGCGGGSRVTPAAALPATSTPQTTAPQGQATFTYGMDALQTAQYVGPANLGSFGMDVTLQAQNAQGLVQYARDASTPGSPLYRHFLTAQQIAATYGASPSTVTAVASYFASYGLHVGTWPQHLSLYVSGSQHALEQALGTTLGMYKQGGTTFIAPRTTPKFARALPVTAITHLVSLPRQFRTWVPVSAGAVTTSGYSPQQIRNAFD
jgi:subtilase family serine protease